MWSLGERQAGGSAVTEISFEELVRRGGEVPGYPALQRALQGRTIPYLGELVVDQCQVGVKSQARQVLSAAIAVAPKDFESAIQARVGALLPGHRLGAEGVSSAVLLSQRFLHLVSLGPEELGVAMQSLQPAAGADETLEAITLLWGVQSLIESCRLVRSIDGDG